MMMMMIVHRFYVTSIPSIIIMMLINDVLAFNVHRFHDDILSRRSLTGPSSAVKLSLMTTKEQWIDRRIVIISSLRSSSLSSSTTTILAASSSPLFTTGQTTHQSFRDHDYRWKRNTFIHTLRSTVSSDISLSPSPEDDSNEKRLDHTFSYRFERLLLQILFIPLVGILGGGGGDKNL
jgi:hypothetical protein